MKIIRSLIYLQFISLVLLSAGCGELPETAQPKKQVIEIIDQDISIELANGLQSILNQHPEAIGMLLSVKSTDGAINSTTAVGKSKKGGTAISPNQSILIASNTKTYVSAAILRLTELHDLTLASPIELIISDKSASELTSRGYNIKEISVVHLLSHTSGIRDYAASDEYMNMIKGDPKHRWTRDEQINLAMLLGDPLGSPGWGFSYADVNYLLATEIIEHYSQKPFYTAMRELLKYEELGINSTWFYTLEAVPSAAEEVAYQYWTSEELDNQLLDPSADLFGGGGIASSTGELAKFTKALFEGKVFDNAETIDLMMTKMPIGQGDDPNYLLGLSESNTLGYKQIGHGGFWATTCAYFPELKTTVSVAIMERDARSLRKEVLEMAVTLIAKDQGENESK